MMKEIKKWVFAMTDTSINVNIVHRTLLFLMMMIFMFCMMRAFSLYSLLWSWLYHSLAVALFVCFIWNQWLLGPGWWFSHLASTPFHWQYLNINHNINWQTTVERQSTETANERTTRDQSTERPAIKKCNSRGWIPFNGEAWHGWNVCRLCCQLQCMSFLLKVF